MTITIGGSTITFNSGNTQSLPIQTTEGGLGAYTVAYSATSTTGTNTVAGSDLGYYQGSTFGIYNTGYSTFYLIASSSPTRTSYSYTGTWRVMMSSGFTASTSEAQLLVRVA